MSYNLTELRRLIKLFGERVKTDEVFAASMAEAIVAAATKATPVDVDLLPLVDSEDGNALKSIAWSEIQPRDPALTDIAGLTPSNGDYLAFDGSNWVDRAIVGTVSQSGGVPTGAIVERGSNANGEYVRLTDGTQICVLPFSAGITVSSTTAVSGGNFFRSTNAESYLWTYPAAFVAAPVVTGNAQNSETLVHGTDAGSNTCRVRALKMNSSDASLAVSVRAEGRWF